MAIYDSSRSTTQYWRAGVGAYAQTASFPFTGEGFLRSITDTGFEVNGTASRTFYYFAIK